MEIKTVLAEAIRSIGKARKIGYPKNEIEISALRWELYASLQNILDAIAMIISDIGLRHPSSYSDLGIVLYEAKLIGKNEFKDIKLIASTRNMLVHVYRKLTIDDLKHILEEILPKAEHIVTILEKILVNRNIDPEHKVMKLKDMDEIFRKHGVVLAYLFGSRAKGLEREDSDYDIAVLFNRNVTIIDEIKLALDIADKLKLPVEMIDITALNKADLLFKARILREGIPIYVSDEDMRRRWERKTYLKILSTIDLYKIYTTRILKKHKSKTIDVFKRT